MKRILLFVACSLLLAPFARAQQPVQSLGSGVQGTSDAAWTSATGSNTAVTLISNTASYNSILVTLVQGSTITGGVVTFEQSIDNSTWTTVQGVTVGSTTIMGPTYTLVASTNVSFLFPVNAPYFRIRLSTVITGSGTVTVQHASQTMPEVGLLAGTETLGASSNVIGHVIADSGSTTAATQATAANLNATVVQATGSNLHVDVDTALPAGSALIGKVGVDQTTPGTTNAIEPIPDTATAVAVSASVKNSLTTAVNVKASAGNVYGVSAANGAAAVCWVQFINSSGAGTLGTAVIFSIALPVSGVVTIPPGTLAMSNFSSGIAVGIASSTNSSTACGTAGNVTVFYK